MMRGIEEWNRHAVAAVRDSRATSPTGHDPYGGTGEWSFRRNADAIKAYWADGIRRMKRAEHRGRGHPRHARQRRRQPARRRRHRPDGERSSPPSGRSSPRTAARPRRRSRRCGPSTRRSSGTGTRAAPAGRRDRRLLRRQLGQHAQAARPGPARAQRRLRHVLPLRLRRRRPQLQVGRHGQPRQHLGAAAPRVHATASTGCGWSTSAT